MSFAALLYGPLLLGLLVYIAIALAAIYQQLRRIADALESPDRRSP